MKKAFFILFATLSLTSLLAQKKDTVSKDETISYINGKVAETIGHDKIATSQTIFLNKKKVESAYFKKTMTGIELYISYKVGDQTFFTSTYFNPKHIVSISNTSIDNVGTASPIGTLEIKLIGNVGISNNNGDSATVDKATFDYLQTDPQNLKRIYKALMYLKSLYAAEDIRFDSLK